MHSHLVTAILTAATVVTAAPQPQTPSAPVSWSAVAVTRKPLSPFPHVRWPGTAVAKDAPTEQALGHFRFWDGTALQDVEGHTMLVTLVARRSGAFDEPALHRRIAADVARAGGATIAEGQMPAALLDTVNDADKKALAPGLGEAGRDPTQTWLIRRPDRQVWIQYTGGATQASLAVVGTKPG